MTPELAGRRIAIASMIISAGLAAAKITIGLHASSTATVSDGIESAGDVLASGLVLLGLIIAAKPPDAEHPYGHGRLETLSALAVGMLLAATGVLIAFESLHLSRDATHAPARLRRLAAHRLHRHQVHLERVQAPLWPQNPKLRLDCRRLE